MRTLLTVDLSAIQSNACMISDICPVALCVEWSKRMHMDLERRSSERRYWLEAESGCVDSAAEAAQLIAGGIRCPILLLT